MTDKPRRAVRRRRTTRRLSRKPIRVPADHVPRAPDVEVEVEFDEPTYSGPPTIDLMDNDLESSAVDSALGAGPSYDDEALPAGAQSEPAPPPDEVPSATGADGESDDDALDERTTDPNLGAKAAAASEETASGGAADPFDDDPEEMTTAPRIELSAEMVAAAGRVSVAHDAPMSASTEPVTDEDTDPRIDVAAKRAEHEASAPRKAEEPSVVVSPARFISSPPPARRTPPPEAAPPERAVEVAEGMDGEPEAIVDEEGTLASLEEALDEIDLDAGDARQVDLQDGEPKGAEELELAEGDAQRSKGPPPPPPSKQQRSKAPPPPPQASTSRVPGKQARGWWMDLFSEDYLQTVKQPTPKQIEHQCDFVMAALGLQPGATVLDVGCGLGWHAMELARRGCVVVGVDLSLTMVSRAADEAREQGLQVNFLHGDMRELELESTFDAVICLGTTFGFFDDETNTDALRRMHRALRPGGRLLIDVVNRDFVIGSQPNLVWFEGTGCVCMEESDFNYFSSRLFVKRTVMHEDGRQSNNEYSLRLYSLHELGQLMQHRGFKVIEVSGLEATRGIFFGTSSARLIIVGERRQQEVEG